LDCPVDATTLQMTDRQGIEIDYCPSCRGVWLDRGELDKLIERSQQFEAAPASQRYPERSESEPDGAMTSGAAGTTTTTMTTGATVPSKAAGTSARTC